MATKCKLEDYDDFDKNRAIRNSIKKRNYLIQGMIGTLSDCELDTDDDINDDDNDDDTVWIPQRFFRVHDELKSLLCNMFIYPYQEGYEPSLRINPDNVITSMF